MLLEILRCPRCMGAFTPEEEKSVLVCDQGHQYPVIDGIPDLVVE
jgi:uncharacterized protein YbaR (Trm112 family)